MNMQQAFEQVVNDPRYLRNVEFGKPRPGHPEGAVREHIMELEGNLEALKDRLTEEEYWKLKFLIHVHDTFKAEASPGVAIADPNSHASLARSFASRFTADQDLLNMIQYHDEGYALWRQLESSGRYNHERFQRLLQNVKNWDLFLAFNIVDSCTQGKGRDFIKWLVGEVRRHASQSIRVDGSWILP